MLIEFLARQAAGCMITTTISTKQFYQVKLVNVSSYKLWHRQKIETQELDVVLPAGLILSVA